MTSHDAGDDGLPPPHLGDFPHGAYWSAERPADADEVEAESPTVQGTEIRLMWDYGVRVPLWDETGLLPEEPAWLRDALGLSAPLIEELTRWGEEMDAVDAAPSRRTPEAYEQLDRRARALARRLQDELGARFTVRYRPW
ncbi:hypothetical protein [Nocardioides caldifontis]|uniref:hypothetical protein n=1 Tax=Nocardioides caldifontis TaxID=2588938 RepID=UPI0011DFC525|nr:hypothetical protein [Nocardioides caldifontis]